MRDEDLQSLKELEQYIANNPNDMSAIIYSAYRQDYEKWEESILEVRDCILDTQQKMLFYSQMLYSLTKWKNFWRKLFKRPYHKEHLKGQIKALEEKNIKLLDTMARLVKTPPEDWRYKLAATGNNLFTAR